MSVQLPPLGLARAVDRRAPGIYAALIDRLLVGVRPGDYATSWWRDAATNRAVGGHPDSQHLLGLAFDIASPDLNDLYRRLATTGLVAVREATHVHVQAWPAGIARSTGLLASLGL